MSQWIPFMRTRLHFRCLIVGLLAFATAPVAAQDSGGILAKATQLFGSQLNVQGHAFPLNDTWVVWLALDRSGNLFESALGPRSYYTFSFPDAQRPMQEETLSESEYENVLKRISQLKDIGALERRHEAPTPSYLGVVNTDGFQLGFVERFVSSRNSDRISRFRVHFLQDISASPRQLMPLQGHTLVCFAGSGMWYYIRPQASRALKFGQWQTVSVAGPSPRLGIGGCSGPQGHDEDGFTIEEPATLQISLADPFRTATIAGQVTIHGQPLEGALVEVHRLDGRQVLRDQTDAGGNFRIARAGQGEYKFKVTKNGGVSALSGIVAVDRTASNAPLALELHLGY
jgi:hypothetical protein